MEATDVYELLYTSRICLTAHPSCVADIMRVSRSRNTLDGITGVLVFDGQSFCQYLEGTQDAVLALTRSIAGDPRHEKMIIKHQGLKRPPRRFPHWSMGYATCAEDGVLLQVEQADAQQAVDAFLAVLPSFSFSP